MALSAWTTSVTPATIRSYRIAPSRRRVDHFTEGDDPLQELGSFGEAAPLAGQGEGRREPIGDQPDDLEIVLIERRDGRTRR